MGSHAPQALSRLSVEKRAQQGMTAVWWATNVGSRAGNRPAPAPV